MSRVIINIFAVIGSISVLVTATVALLFYDINAGSDIEIISSLPSPDDKYVATTYSSMGGGAAGWCHVRVAIHPASSPFSSLNKNARFDTDVYSGNCGIAPQLDWLSSSVLQITLPKFFQDSWSSASFKGISQSGTITVKFDFPHNQALKSQPSAVGGVSNGVP